MKRKIGIIGSGIAGMTCAWHLRDLYDVTLLEKNDYIGGHTNTVVVKEGENDVPIDTGFMVFNDHTYPQLNRFFDELEIASDQTDMSFGVNLTEEGRAYASSGIGGIFAQPGQVLNWKQWAMVIQIPKFFKAARAFLEQETSETMSISEFFEQANLGKEVARSFFLPMASSIWSTHHEKIEDFPALSLFRFMANHGLLGIGDQFKWKTVRGGSRVYRDKIVTELGDRVIKNFKTNSVIQKDRLVHVKSSYGVEMDFDLIIIASHADQALSMLEKPTELQSDLLSNFGYTHNTAVLHSDTSVMPKHRRAWASWNYRVEPDSDGQVGASTHYWMNNLQNLPTERDYFVSIDYNGAIDPNMVHWQMGYEHPSFDAAAMNAQKDLQLLNKDSKILFCGSYFGYGFHEDAHASAMKVVDKLINQPQDHELQPLQL
jgi:predicted NAD/FAD-binding protein